MKKTFLVDTNLRLIPISAEDDYDTMTVIDEGISNICNTVIDKVGSLDTLGFLDMKGPPATYEFKIQDLTNRRSAGRSCSSILITNINNVIPKEVQMKLIEMNIMGGAKFPKEYLCMLTLFIFRYYDYYITYEMYQCIRK
jgi:hypothetical protein